MGDYFIIEPFNVFRF